MSRAPYLGLILLLASIPSRAAVFVVPADSDLIQQSSAIVIGTVTGIHSEFTIEGPIVTNIDFEVEEVLKGPIDRSEPLRLREPGGVIGEYATGVSGSPHYWIGNRALVFLERTDDGYWTTWGMSLGKFDFVRDREGRDLAVRWATQSDILAWTPEGHPHEERLRNARLFVAFLRADAQPVLGPRAPREPQTLEVNGAESGYFVDDVTTEEVSFLPPVTDAHYPPTAYTEGTFRWRVFDQGGSASYRTSGSQPGYDSTGAAQRGLAAWTNDPGSNVNIQYGGTTSAGFVQDSINSIVFNSATGVPAGSVGYAQWFGSGTHTYKGQTFYSIVEGDVVIKSGLSVSQKLFDEIVTHELGHTIGLRHSDQGTPSSTQAVMKAILSGNYGATLGPWDIEAVRHVYEQTASSCTPPSVSFTDDPLVPGVTRIKAIHLIELRNAVNAWRAAAGLAAFTAWTNPSPAGATVKAVHILELRNALDPALRACGRTPSFSSGVAIGQPVRAIHFQELRNQMK